ncbi:helix-turn-helix domain-containing protein [Halobaculum halobium]|uniref:Helix-turn-helix domain-containing protein n=1 Tax=Halobaculum halobium TaxID=3032281 RepID=A0ABD5TAE8_9EURY
MNETSNYYAIIPANVRYNNSIQQGAKLLYGEITALSNKTGCCWAGDQYFMGLYKVSQATIQRWLTSLEKNGYIDRTVKYKDGSKEIEKRYIRINAYPILKNENTYTQKCEYPILKMSKRIIQVLII